MALRNQPYFPLYVQDFLTDEKLIECSAESTGVYIRLICILHKSEEYGLILLKQKDKQNDNNIRNFAIKLVKQMPYEIDVIEKSLKELIEEKVLTLEDDKLFQKRMVRDGKLSDIRAEAGKKGANKKNNKDFAKAKKEANTETKVLTNTENEYEYEKESESEYKNILEVNKRVVGGKEETFYKTVTENVINRLNELTGSNFRASNKETQKLINGRLNDGYTEEDLIEVVEKMVVLWSNTKKGEKDMREFLRPSTLFRPTNFENYLNRKVDKRKLIVNDFVDTKGVFDD